MNHIKVIILAGQGESTALMVNGIKDFFSIEKILIEAPVKKNTFLTKRVRKLGLAKVIGQILFVIYNKIWLKPKSEIRINEIKHNKNLNDETIDSSLVLEVDSINSLEVKKILIEYQPDVVVVNGTRIIKKDIIESIDAPFINTHAGITPKYRGVHGAYWALTKNDIAHCGVTVHLVDTGIDTGGVLHQDLICVTDKDTFNTYPYLQMAAGIPLIKKSIIEIANKTYKTRELKSPSKLWSHPTIIEYLKHLILQKVR